jgi:hypothetical protein
MRISSVLPTEEARPDGLSGQMTQRTQSSIISTAFTTSKNSEIKTKHSLLTKPSRVDSESPFPRP